MLLDPGKGRRFLFRMEFAQDQKPKTTLQPLGRNRADRRGLRLQGHHDLLIIMRHFWRAKGNARVFGRWARQTERSDRPRPIPGAAQMRRQESSQEPCLWNCEFMRAARTRQAA